MAVVKLLYPASVRHSAAQLASTGISERRLRISGNGLRKIRRSIGRNPQIVDTGRRTCAKNGALRARRADGCGTVLALQAFEVDRSWLVP
jgi:hypothetical protein